MHDQNFKIFHNQVSLLILSQEHKHEKKLRAQQLASAAATPSGGTATLLGSAGACNAWSLFQKQVSLFILQQAPKTRATAPSLCSCHSFFWFRCFAWVFWCLQCMIKISQSSLTLRSFASTQAQKKQKKTRAAAPSLCSCHSFFGYCCFAWVCWRLECMIKMSESRFTLHSFASSQAQKETRATAPSLCSCYSFFSYCCFTWVFWCLQCMIKISKYFTFKSHCSFFRKHVSKKRNSGHST